MGTPAEAAVFVSALTQGPISRSDIARTVGLSSAAVTRAAQPLLDAHFLAFADESGAAPTAPVGGRLGRPSRPVVVNTALTGTIGIKLSAHEVVGVVIDLGGEVRATCTVSLPAPDVEAALTATCELIDDLSSRAAGLGFEQPITWVGLSLSGDIDHATGLVRYSPFLGWRDVDLGPVVAARTGLRVVVENDVKALTAAEQWFGHARGMDDFAIVTIGTGIGSALVVDGALVRGAHSVAGEIGHLPVGDPDLRCHCGGRGCVEAEASTAALERRCREAVGERDLTLDQAMDLARAGDEALAAVFARAGRVIGLAIASLVNLVGPEQVIVSGEGISSFDLTEGALREAFAEQTFGAGARTALHVQPLPFEEWARGAAAVAIEELAFPSQAASARRTAGNSHD